VIPEYMFEHAPALIIAIPLLGAFCTPLISRLGGRVRNSFVLAVLILTGLFITLLSYDVLSNGARIYIFGAKDLSLPVVRILFEVDALSVLMGIITFILALSSAVYSWSFMKKEETGLDKFYTLMLLLVTSTLGMEFTGDLFNFFVFLEITCISSCALIAFMVYKDKALEAGFKYIVLSSIGALFILFAIGLLYGQYNALNIATLAKLLEFSFLDKIALVLFIIVLAMKAGLAPMHMWLPDAYGESSSSVTLVIMGATQASVYGILRVCFTLYGSVFQGSTMSLSVNSLAWVLIGLSILSIFTGVIMALIQSDLNRLIGYTAVAEVGYILLGVSTSVAAKGEPYGLTALKGGVFHMFNDVLDIGLLFLVAGAVFYATDERSLDKLGGLARSMRYTTMFFIIGLLAVSGMPPLNGFASKLLIYESTYRLNPLLSIIAILCSILMLAVFVKVFYSVFLGAGKNNSNHLKNVKEAPVSMLIGMGVLTVFIIISALFPDVIIKNLVEPAANSLISYNDYINHVLNIGGAL